VLCIGTEQQTEQKSAQPESDVALTETGNRADDDTPPDDVDLLDNDSRTQVGYVSIITRPRK